MLSKFGENTSEPPLIVQQDAKKRNNKYLRVTKDGQVSMVGVER